MNRIGVTDTASQGHPVIDPRPPRTWPFDPNGRRPDQPELPHPIGNPLPVPHGPRRLSSPGPEASAPSPTLEAVPAAARTTAEQTATIADGLARTARATARPPLAAGLHGGWAIAAALECCADGWERELTGTAAAVHDVGDRLTVCANNYDATEQAITQQFDTIRSAGGGPAR